MELNKKEQLKKISFKKETILSFENMKSLKGGKCNGNIIPGNPKETCNGGMSKGETIEINIP